jgi:hypothetical protein
VLLSQVGHLPECGAGKVEGSKDSRGAFPTFEMLSPSRV